ncbi:MAG: SsrA-binding protein SmpB [Holosporales bacterium]|jgi:SsrA-binding protein|nr:SsrA-binding protein SmpB [Holosporales bacterium]
MSNFKIVAKNRRARFDYEITETVEAGIILTGSEIKSIRNGRVSINESFVGTVNRSIELYLFNADVSLCKQASYNNHEPRRPRALLLHKIQRTKFLNAIQQKGMTIVPLTMYLNHRGIVKISIALAKGKNVVDKRETIKRRDWALEKAKIMKKFNR